MAEQTYNIDLVPISNPVVVPVSQYDVGRNIVFNLLWNGASFSATGYNVILSGEFQNGKSFSLVGTVSGSKVTFKCTAQSTAFSGRCLAEVRVSNGSNNSLGSSNFLWKVEESPDLSKGVTAEDISVFQQLLNQAQAAAGNAQNYANQANTYAQQAKSYAESVLVERRYIFIGDSYGAGLKMSDTSKNWITKVKSYMGLSSSRAYSSAVSGSGFIGQDGVTTFTQQLTSLSISSPGLITDVVVLGGWNDVGNDSSTLLSAINTFIDTVESTYPNATVHIGFVSWCDSYKRYATSGSSNPTHGIRDVLEVYSRCGRHGAAFIEGMQYVLHNMTYFTSDGLHPNESGQEAIATHLANYLRGGKISVIYENWRDENAAAANPGATTAWIYTYLNNNRCRLLLYQSSGFRVNFNSAVSFNKAAGFGGSGTEYHDVCTLSDNCCLRGGAYTELQYSGPCMYLSGGTWYEGQGFLRMGSPSNGKSNTLQVALAKTTGSAYASITNVTEVWFPMSNIFMEADPMHC